MAKRAHDRGDLIVLFGHHNYENLSDDAKKTLERFHTNYGAIVYVSAHDHEGKWRALGKGGDTWPELNVGAMLDSPIELRHLSIRLTRDNRVAIVAPLFRLDSVFSGPVAPLDNSNPRCTQDHAIWEAQRGERGFYISYRDLGLYQPVLMQRTMLNTMLGSYRRYFDLAQQGSNAPTLPVDGPAIDDAIASNDASRKISVLKQLVAASQQGAPSDELRAFAVCQAWWGAKYARLKRRLPNPTDTAVVLPTTIP
jgi:hypothetical protein